jgi:hypothetical protein
MTPGEGRFGGASGNFDSNDFRAINNGRIFVKNVPPEMLRKI